MKKLMRSRDQRILSGVIGGIAEHYGIDPTLPRLGFVLFLLVTGIFPGVFLYLIAVFLMPEAPRMTPSQPIDDAPPV
jgi:phage shock protein C